MEYRASMDGPALPLPGRLAEAVVRELSADEPSPERLAESVRAYALEAYARDVPPERMLVSLKSVIGDATDSLDARARAALIAALIPFALEGYYLDPWVRRTGEIRGESARRTKPAPDGEAARGEH